MNSPLIHTFYIQPCLIHLLKGLVHSSFTFIIIVDCISERRFDIYSLDNILF